MPVVSGRPVGLMEADRWTLVGRERECAALANALDEGPGRSIVIAGPAGAGRTRLAREALRFAENRQQPTRWTAATSAAGHVPLGALAHLLPTFDDASDSLVLLQRAVQAVTGDDGERPPVLGVDDVHLLDPLSVTLLHQLAISGVVNLVLTVRTGIAAPDPAAPLWKDGMATRLELRTLSRPDTDRLAGQVLDGDVDTRTSERLWRLSQGNPLFLRELLDDGLHTGRLHASGGLWSWEGAIVPSERLTEIVLTQLGELDPDQWRALEVLATAEPLGVHEVVGFSSPEAVASLERRGVITDGVAGRAGEVRAAHPLYTEVVRSRVPEAALSPIRRRLTEAQAGPASDGQLLRRCAVLLDDMPPNGQLLTEAAGRAIEMLDYPLAERLARAGMAAGGGTQAHLALVEAARWQGHPALSERLAVEAASVAATDEDRARLTATRVLTLFCGLGEAGEAATVLREATEVVHGTESSALLAAADAILAFLGGDPQRAVRQATSVLDSAMPGGAARPLAAAAAAAGLAVTGATGRALVAAQTGWAALEAAPEGTELAFVRIALAQAEVMALHLGGRIHELDHRAAELYRRNLTAPEWAGDAVACLHRGWAALAGGRPRVAIRWLIEAFAGFERRDPAGMQPVCSSLLATARALVGDTGGARELLTDRRRTHHPAITVFHPLAHSAAAWLAAAEGRTADAGTLSFGAAALAAEQGQPAVEAMMLYRALRFGRQREALSRLRELAGCLDSLLVVLFAAHAEATVAGSGEHLDLVSRRFEDVGALLYASDAAAEAATVHEQHGDRRAAVSSSARAVALARAGGLTDTPALEVLSPPTLTAREEQVARLAARGLSNQAIADRLVVSVRTVEAHLAHVYTKVGISGRADLHTALELTSSRPERRSAGGAPVQRTTGLEEFQDR